MNIFLEILKNKHPRIRAGDYRNAWERIQAHIATLEGEAATLERRGKKNEALHRRGEIKRYREILRTAGEPPRRRGAKTMRTLRAQAEIQAEFPRRKKEKARIAALVRESFIQMRTARVGTKKARAGRSILRPNQKVVAWHSALVSVETTCRVLQ